MTIGCYRFELVNQKKKIIQLTVIPKKDSEEQKPWKLPLSKFQKLFSFFGAKVIFYVVKRSSVTNISHVLQYRLMEFNRQIYKYEAVLETIDGSKLPDKITLTDDLKYKFSTLGELKEFIKDNHEFNTLEAAQKEAIERDKE